MCLITLIFDCVTKKDEEDEKKEKKGKKEKEKEEDKQCLINY